MTDQGIAEEFKKIAEMIANSESRLLATIEESESKIEKNIEGLKSKISERLEFQEQRISFYQSSLAMLQVQHGGGAIPNKVRRVPGGYGLHEPRSTWRRERPYGR